MSANVIKRLIPSSWSQMHCCHQLNELEGFPVINLQLWFDQKLKSFDGLCFSRSPLLSVYADMSTCCAEDDSDEASILELVFAPCSPMAGSAKNWIASDNEEIVVATLEELGRLFPLQSWTGSTRKTWRASDKVDCGVHAVERLCRNPG
jgi:15-cis-phytoene desaturase